MNLSDVSVPQRFLSSCPSEEKLSVCRAFYAAHGDIDRGFVPENANPGRGNDEYAEIIQYHTKILEVLDV